MNETVEVISTAHWSGDPRLNRHVGYLVDGGNAASFTTFAPQRRLPAFARALMAVVRSKADIVLLPDPEMFLAGSLLARVSGKRPVIDIHEDYAKAAMARQWVPKRARWLIRLAAAAAVRTGRWAAWRVMVAGHELAISGDYVVLNIPDPAPLEYGSHDGSLRLVYVGDLTVERGALAMVELLAELGKEFHLLLIGGAGHEVKRQIRSMAESLNVGDRLELTGRLEHRNAWNTARGSLAGLNLLSPAPAYRDAVATKLWEYLAVGLPPIVSDLPGQRTMVSQLDESLICDSVEEAAAAARELARDPKRRARLGELGREIVEAKWRQSRPDAVVRSVVRVEVADEV